MAAGANTASLQQIHTLDRLFSAIDPKSLILSQFPNSQNPNNLLQLTTQDTFFMERGPRYEAYANLRDSKLRSKKFNQSNQDLESNLTPPKKQLKYQGSLPMRRKAPSVLAQSVPDFSSALRKENRKPPVPALPPVMEKSATPPAKSLRSNGIPARLGGSKSANSSGEKRNGGLLMGARKSYASMEELKGLGCAAANAINGENRGLRSSSRTTVGKTILGYRQS